LLGKGTTTRRSIGSNGSDAPDYSPSKGQRGSMTSALKDYLLIGGKSETTEIVTTTVVTERGAVLDLTKLEEVRNKIDFQTADKSVKETLIRKERDSVVTRRKEYAERFRRKKIVKKETVLVNDGLRVAKVCARNV
jgi:hypothetical protein